MVISDLSGNIVDGGLSPSSDLATHLELYRAFPSVGGVVHTHSEFATVWAKTGVGGSIPSLATTLKSIT
ncbi:MAG: class II aldolase/adducin family protein [Silvibacterium sp.]